MSVESGKRQRKIYHHRCPLCKKTYWAEHNQRLPTDAAGFVMRECFECWEKKYVPLGIKRTLVQRVIPWTPE